MTTRDVFDSMSPIDFRYWDGDVAAILSENAFTDQKLDVEVALARALQRRSLCSEAVVEEIKAAITGVRTDAVYAEEGRVRHDIRALANLVRAGVSDAAKPFVHMTATSYDIVDSANAMRYWRATEEILIPRLTNLEKVLITITLREAETVQIGRTHGQHAVPITFGFAIAGYVSRLGASIMRLSELAAQLTGKFSGAVGAYNAQALFFDDPERFEEEVLGELGLTPAECSTQIVPPEPLIRLFNEIVISAGIMADMANDMRQLQRTEIGEVGEEFGADQVGSSTMPQKRNPIGPENVISLWKVVMPRFLTMFIDMVSEHQRDLTNSASSRTYGEIIAYVAAMASRLAKVMAKLKVDKANMVRNLELQQGGIAAEPLYLLLAAMGHPDAHEAVRLLTLKAQAYGDELWMVAFKDGDLSAYIERMTETQREIIQFPARCYVGIAAQKAVKVAEAWKHRLNL